MKEDQAMNNKWQARPIKPAPLLAELRDRVFRQSEKRSPKWKFRLAPDLVVQIQPKLTTALLKFECRAVQCAGADTTSFAQQGRRQTERDWWQLSFDLTATAPDEWLLKPTGYTWSKPTHDVWERSNAAERVLSYETNRENAHRLPDRVIAAFEAGHFDRLRPEIMLGHNCMICGKGLTDPVSMARFIGPECAGTASPNLPFTFDLNAA
jgi:hypothetical protein